MKIILPLILLCFASSEIQEVNLLSGKWKFVHYEAIEFIRNSPAYAYGSKEEVEMMEKMFAQLYEEGHYTFTNDTLYYSDFDKNSLITRRALFEINDTTLKIKEIDRPNIREALIQNITSDSLVLIPIINGTIGRSKMIFAKD